MKGNRDRNRKLGVILTLVVVFLLYMTSCATDKKFFLPSFEPVRPDRPILLEVSEDGSQLPVSVKENTVLLTCYIEELEAYADGWEAYYEEVKNEYIQDK